MSVLVPAFGAGIANMIIKSFVNWSMAYNLILKTRLGLKKSSKYLTVELVVLIRTVLLLKLVIPVLTKKMTTSVFLPVLLAIKTNMDLVWLTTRLGYTSGSVTMATLKTVQ